MLDHGEFFFFLPCLDSSFRVFTNKLHLSGLVDSEKIVKYLLYLLRFVYHPEPEFADSHLIKTYHSLCIYNSICLIAIII